MNTLENLNSRMIWSGVEPLKIEGPRRMMELLGNPQDSIPAIIVTGTNGKGSVCSMLSAIQMASGKKVAQFTSPHLQHYSERLLIQGHPVDEKRLLAAIENIIFEEARLARKLSYFELIIAASFLICSQENLDSMIVEVGIGGRLDATNVIKKPCAALITSIGLDHTNILGESEYLIAQEKAGIFRKDVPAFVGVVSSEAKRSISESAQLIGCPVNFLEESPCIDPRMPQYKANNINLTRRVASFLGHSNSEIEDGIAKARWPGRLEEVSLETEQGEQKFVLDGAHNPDGVKGLIDYLNRRVEQEFVFLISIMARKDSSTMLCLLKEWAKDKNAKFIFCKMNRKKRIALRQWILPDPAQSIFFLRRD